VTLAPYYNEQAVSIDGETYRLVINFKTIDATESVLDGRSYDKILGEMLAGNPPVGLQARVVWGLLREHHPEVTLEQASALARGEAGEAVGYAIGKLIMAAFPAAKGKAKDANPPKPRGASRPSSKRGARSSSRKRSGVKLPAHSSLP